MENEDRTDDPEEKLKKNNKPNETDGKRRQN